MMKILLVNNRDAPARTDKESLQAYGYTVETASSGGEAVQRILDDGSFHLVLMSIELRSGIDGPEDAEQILAEKDIPLVYFSSQTGLKGVLRLLEGSRQSMKAGESCNPPSQEEELRQTEKELSRNLQLFRDITENMFDMVALVTLEGEFLYVSPAHERSLGYPAEFLTGRNMIEFVHPEDRDETLNAIAELKQSQTRVKHEVRYRTSRGDYIWIEAVGKLKEDAQGTVTGMIISSRDITEQKRFNQALQESETAVRRKLEALTKPSGDIGVLDLSDIIDTETIQSMMEDFYNTTGMLTAILDMEGNILVGVGWQDICTKFHRANPESRKHCLESDLHLSRGIRPGEFKAYQCKNHLWDMASPLMVGGKQLGNIYFGQFFLAEEEVDRELFRSQAREYGFDEGEYLAALDRVPRFDRETVHTAMSFYTKLAGIISQLSYRNLQLARAFSQQKNTEESLRESEERFKALHNASFGGITIHDKGVILDCNQGLSDITGYPFEELIGMDGLLLIAPDWRNFVMAKITSGYEEPYEAQGIRKDGALYPLRLHAKNIPYRGKEVRVVEFRDITDIKKAHSALEQALGEKQTLLKELNHRIKNSFAMIQSMINLNTSRVQDGEALAVLHDMQSRINTVSRLYTLLHENGISPYTRLDQYCRSIADSLSSSYIYNTGKISFQFDCTPVQTDIKTASLIGIILNEILTNALKYAFPKGSKGKITLSLKQEKGDILLDIQDNGIGIPEDKIPEEGGGLGMKLIRGLVDQIDGELTITAGEGTQFSLRIPI